MLLCYLLLCYLFVTIFSQVDSDTVWVVIHSDLLAHLKVLFEFYPCTAFGIRQVADDLAFLQKCYAGGDVDSVLQVVARDENGGTCLLIILRQDVLEHVLRRRVQKVEGLVENDQFRTVEEGRNDAYLLLVASRQVADEFLASEDLAAGKALVWLQPLRDLRLLDAGNPA